MQIIEQVKKKDLSGPDLDIITSLIQRGNQLGVEFTELRLLETIKVIPKWLKKLYSLVLSSNTNNYSSKTFPELSSDM